MSNSIRSRKKRFIYPIIILITMAAIFLTSYGIALATHSALFPSLYVPLILKHAGNPIVGTSTPTATPTQTGTPTQTLIPTSTQTGTPTQTLTPTSTVSVGPGKVFIVDFAFQPAEITIHVGEIVEWENSGQNNHTTTSNTGVWDSGALAPDQKFSFTFTSVGDYPYHCSIHPNMTGIIHVVPNP
jgi:plastocyanin